MKKIKEKKIIQDEVTHYIPFDVDYFDDLNESNQEKENELIERNAIKNNHINEIINLIEFGINKYESLDKFIYHLNHKTELNIKSINKEELVLELYKSLNPFQQFISSMGYKNKLYDIVENDDYQYRMKNLILDNPLKNSNSEINNLLISLNPDTLSLNHNKKYSERILRIIDFAGQIYAKIQKSYCYNYKILKNDEVSSFNYQYEWAIFLKNYGCKFKNHISYNDNIKDIYKKISGFCRYNRICYDYYSKNNIYKNSLLSLEYSKPEIEIEYSGNCFQDHKTFFHEIGHLFLHIGDGVGLNSIKLPWQIKEFEADLFSYTIMYNLTYNSIKTDNYFLDKIKLFYTDLINKQILKYTNIEHNSPSLFYGYDIDQYYLQSLDLIHNRSKGYLHVGDEIFYKNENAIFIRYKNLSYKNAIIELNEDYLC